MQSWIDAIKRLLCSVGTTIGTYENLVLTLSFLLAIVSVVISLRAYTKTKEIEHIKIQLDKRQHADLVTPVITIKKVNAYVSFHVQGFDFVEIENLRKISDSRIRFNEFKEINLSDIKIIGRVEINIINTAMYSAEIDLEISLFNKQYDKKHLQLDGNSTNLVTSDISIDINNYLQADSAIKSTMNMDICIESWGVGLSARDYLVLRTSMVYISRKPVDGAPEVRFKIVKSERKYSD